MRVQICWRLQVPQVQFVFSNLAYNVASALSTGDQIEADDLAAMEAGVETLAPSSAELVDTDSRPGTAISTASGATKLSTMKELVKDLTERVAKVELSEQSLKLQVTVRPLVCLFVCLFLCLFICIFVFFFT